MTAIWVVDWELGDEGAVVTVGDHLDWIACEPDRTTPTSLRGRAVDLHMSPDRLHGYGHPGISVVGVVTAVAAVLCDVREVAMGAELVVGSEVLDPVASTNERWWEMCSAHALSGFLVTVGDAAVAPTVATDDRSEWHAGLGPPPSSTPPPAAPRWTPPLHPSDLARIPPGATAFVAVSGERPPASRCQHPAHRR